jgi:hypothetical protein
MRLLLALEAPKNGGNRVGGWGYRIFGEETEKGNREQDCARWGLDSCHMGLGLAINSIVRAREK